MDKLADLLNSIKLQPHQQRVFDDVKSNPPEGVRKLLMWQLGSGKSLGGLAGAEAANSPYTVIVPASLRQTWQTEQDKFTDRKTPSDVISYTAAAKGYPADKLDTLVTDESHRMRNPGSKQTQNIAALADKAKNLFMLTGTPLVNEPADIAPLMSMLLKKEVTPTEFNTKYVQEKEVAPSLFQRLRGITSGTELDINNEQELRNLLKGHVDYYSPDKPIVPTNFEDHEVEMSQPQAELYKMMFDKLPWIVRWKLQRNYPLSREEFMRMRSFMTGPRQVGLSTYPFLKNKSSNRAFDESSKLQKAFGLLNDKFKDDRAKALVFSNFIDAGLTPYSAALEKAKIPHAVFHGGLNDLQRKKLVEDYNTNKIRVALLGPSGAEGLSFKGTQLVQLLDPYWHNVRTRQQQGRGIRFDSHLDLPDELKNVTVQRFIAKLPLSMRDRFWQSLGFDRSAERIGADDILRNLSSRKDQLNDKFTNLLKEVGSQKQAAEIEQPSVPLTAGGIAALLPILALRKKLEESNLSYPIQDLTLPYTRPEKPEDKKTLWKKKEEPAIYKLAAMTRLPISLPIRKPEPTVTLDEGVGPKLGLLDKLKEIKQFSDNRNWQAKHMRLREVMDETPWQWDVADDPKVGPRFVGVKHIPTSWKYHMPRELVPSSVYADIQFRKKPAIEVD